MAGLSLVNLGEITKPASRLIEKSSDAVRGLLLPWQIGRVGAAETAVEARRIRDLAQAEVDAEIARAKGEIQITGLRRRAERRAIEEMTTHQENMESVLSKAIPQLEPDSRPEEVENDWYANFFSKCRITSDAEMQDLWARILAGQANNPGTFSRKTVNLMADLDKRDAELFANLCRFVWRIGKSIMPLVFDTKADIYNHYYINFGTIGHLESLGLIHFSGLADFVMLDLPKQVSAQYLGMHTILTLPNEKENKLSTGNVIFTQAGGELARVVNPTGITEFFDYVWDKWASESLVPPREPQPET